MPFREKMRKALGRDTSSSEGGSTATKTKSNADIYKPGEVPPSKYRSPYNKPHQDKLKAFSFGDTFSRRRSDQTEISPMGSRMPSRKNSATDGQTVALPRRSNVGRVVENIEADDDVQNVGLSRQATSDQKFQSRIPKSEELLSAETESNTKLNGHAGHKPFTEDELTLALTQSTLRGPGQAAAV
ncbi:MAG: hypothetical protein M1812_002345 [Candelaria pacifica]|nr:MAG: hypothetical protein M1812_002345 [Candelaria pacifica]